MGWRFTLAEFVGGIVLIALMWALLRIFVSPRLEAEAREHALAGISITRAARRSRGALFALTFRRGAADPLCGMTVDKAKALTATVDGKTYYFCGEHCRHSFLGEAAHLH